MCDWDEKLQDQVTRDWENYRKKRFDLTTARVEELVNMSGDFFYIEGASSEAALATVKFNRNTNEALAVKQGTTIKTVFKGFYLSNTAQAGQWIDLILGVNFEKIDAGPGLDPEAAAFVNTTGSGANDDITYASLATTEIMVMADYGNAGDLWVNLDAAGAVDIGWRLDSGDWIKISLSNMDRLNVRIIADGDKIIILRSW